MTRVISLILGVLLLSGVCWAAEKPVINGEDDEISYSVGHQVGRDLVRQGVKVNPELLMQGILDATTKNEPLMTFEKMIDTLAVLKERIVTQAKQKNLSVRILGEKFLADNALKEGVVSLPSGLQYKIVKAGDGQSPTSVDRVKVNYTGKDIDGKVFGSTTLNGKETPVEFNVTDVVPGWLEALEMMKEGSKWEIYLPYQLAFKDRGPLAGQTVIFEIELLQVLK